MSPYTEYKVKMTMAGRISYTIKIKAHDLKEAEAIARAKAEAESGRTFVKLEAVTEL